MNKKNALSKADKKANWRRNFKSKKKATTSAGLTTKKKKKKVKRSSKKGKKAFVAIAEVAEAVIKVCLNRTNSLLTNLQECYLDLTNYS